MTDRVKLSRIDTEFESLSYPVSRDEVAEKYADTTVTYADGETNLGELIEQTSVERFDDASDVNDALQNVMPVEAVGEPGQSDGDA